MKIVSYIFIHSCPLHWCNKAVMLAKLLFIYATCFVFATLTYLATMFAPLISYLFIFLAGKLIQHRRRGVISLHSCNKPHSLYLRLELDFLPEKCNQAKGSMLLKKLSRCSEVYFEEINCR